MRSGEERSDELRERVHGTSPSNADISVLSVAVANSAAVSNAPNTPFFATRFACRSYNLHHSIALVASGVGRHMKKRDFKALVTKIEALYTSHS